MKSKLAKNFIGRTIFQLQRYRDLYRLPIRNPEKASMVANAIIADRLIERITPEGGTFFDIGAQYGAIFSAAYANDLGAVCRARL
jgi:hypothetical protein